MPMKNPPHPGRGLRRDCAEAGHSGGQKAGRGPCQLIPRAEWASGHLTPDGLEARSGGLVERRFLDASPSGLRLGASAATPGEISRLSRNDASAHDPKLAARALDMGR